MASEKEETQTRPMPCPECASTKGYSRVGVYRVQCLGCNGLLKNSEVDLKDQIANKESV